MNYLGISDFQYNSGISLINEEGMLFSVNEERLSRIKNDGGFPFLSLLELGKILDQDSSIKIDKICVSSIMNPPIFVRYFDFFRKLENGVRGGVDEGFTRYLSDFIHFNTQLTTSSPGTLFGKITKLFLNDSIRRKLPKYLEGVPLCFVEHHLAHAASAFYNSGFKEALCITADEMGDGVSLSVNKCANREIERIGFCPYENSFGYFYRLITEVLGFLPNRHEGKVMALAAWGNPHRVKHPFPFKKTDNGKVIYTGGFGISEVKKLRRLLGQYSREDIASWLQHNCKEYFKSLVQKWMLETGLSNLVLAGGFFANIGVNQALCELDSVKNFFVYPNMGDGGISHGAALAIQKPVPSRIPHLYWGIDYSDEEIGRALKKSGISYRFCVDVETEAAKILAQGFTVARFKGRFEWGPRALGNRSILYHAKDKSVNDWLNKKLRRSEFMPFAPVTMFEDVDEYYVCSDKAKLCAEFMTMSLACTEKMRQENPAAVHVDGTSRPQLIHQEANPDFYRLIKEYKRITGLGCLLNTSFNMHEEPIVSSPDSAIEAFKISGLDYLAIGNFLAGS